MLPPPALASGRHPAHTDGRGAGGAKTLPLQTGQGKAATINLLQKNDGNQIATLSKVVTITRR